MKQVPSALEIHANVGGLIKSRRYTAIDLRSRACSRAKPLARDSFTPPRLAREIGISLGDASCENRLKTKEAREQECVLSSSLELTTSPAGHVFYRLNARTRNAAICARVTELPGQYMAGEQPCVMFNTAIRSMKL